MIEIDNESIENSTVILNEIKAKKCADKSCRLFDFYFFLRIFKGNFLSKVSKSSNEKWVNCKFPIEKIKYCSSPISDCHDKFLSSEQARPFLTLGKKVIK